MRARPQPAARFQTLVESSMSNGTNKKKREKGGSFTERRFLANYQNLEKSANRIETGKSPIGRAIAPR